MTRGVSRREFLRTIVVTAGAVKFLGACGDDNGSPDGGPPDGGGTTSVFPQSVVSGDPRSDSIVLWTRADSGGGDVSVTLEVATDDQFTSMVTLSESSFTAQAASDNCLRIKVVGLDPGTRYFYRFRAAGAVSNTGRFKTAAAATADVPVRFGVLSCQDYIGRYYNTLTELLDPAQDDLDFVVHLGDYIYETTGDPQFQQGSGRHITFTDQAGAEQLGSGDGIYYAAKSISNYRQLWKTYRSDPTLQRVHEKFPFIVIWDDHEFVDDCWQDAINYSDGLEVELDPERRRNSEQAFFEFQPVALDTETGEGALSLDRAQLFPNTRLYRDFRFGKHLHLLMTDYRSFRPDHPIPEDGFPGKVVMTAAEVAATPGHETADVVALLAPYVDIDAAAYAVHKATLQAVLQQAYPAAGATTERTAALVAAATQGNVDANVLNSLFAPLPAEQRPPVIATDELPRGVSLAAMGKGSLFGLVGARYLVLKPTYDLYATFLQGEDLTFTPYGAAQSTWVTEKLDAEPDATWKVLANSTALTSLVVDLEQFEEQLGGLLPATKLYLNVDQWDGFSAARTVLFTRLAAKNAVIISGDIHAAYFTDYGPDDGNNRVVEFTGPGVSSGAFADLLRSTAESIPALSGNPLVDLLISVLDGLLPTAFPALKYSNSSVNGVVTIGVSATQLQGTYAVVTGSLALMDRTSDTVPFQRRVVVVPKVDGKNGEPTIS